jgi:hypothetical protein
MPSSGIKELFISGRHLFDFAVGVAPQLAEISALNADAKASPRLPALANAVYHLWYAERAGVSTGLFRCGG